MNITEKTVWEGSVYQLSRADKVEGGTKGAANIQARQLANRTQFLKVLIEGISDYREYTFFETEEDPDGTIAGLAGTPQGKLFRVALGEGEALAFRYFLNDGGVARAVTGLLGQGSIINSVRFFPSLPLAENDLSAGNIPEGGNCWVINHSDSSLADEYANVSGALQQTGRKMLSQEAVEAALQLIAKLTSSGFVDDNFFPLFVDGAGSVPAWWDDGFAVSRVAMSLYQMIYTDVRARLGDSVNAGVSGVNNTFFPLVVDGDNNIPLFWDNGFNVSMISEGFQQKVWSYINAIIEKALNQRIPLVDPSFVPGITDAADSVPFWFQDGEFDATGIGPNIRGIFARWYQRRMYTAAYNIPLHTDGRTLWRWKAKKAQLKAGLAVRPHFMLTGDSWTQNNELAAAIAGLLHADYGDAGLGWRTVNYGAARDGSNIFRSAGWDLYDSSPTSGAPLYGCGIDGQSINTTTNTAYFNVTNVRCTDCQIYYQDLNGKFQYGYDVGGVTQWTEVVCGNTGATKSVLLTGMTDEVRTIYVKTDGNAGRVAIHGFYLWRSGVAGCVMSKAGNAGILADQFLLFSDKIAEYLSTMQPDVICIVIGNNDYRISESTATFRTALQKYMAACRAVLPDVGFILMAPPRTNGTAATPLVDFRDVMYDLSQTLNVEFFSIYDLFDTWAEMNGLGCFLDNLHPNAVGGNLIASALNNALIKG